MLHRSGSFIIPSVSSTNLCPSYLWTQHRTEDIYQNWRRMEMYRWTESCRAWSVLILTNLVGSSAFFFDRWLWNSQCNSIYSLEHSTNILTENKGTYVTHLWIWQLSTFLKLINHITSTKQCNEQEKTWIIICQIKSFRVISQMAIVKCLLRCLKIKWWQVLIFCSMQHAMKICALAIASASVICKGKVQISVHDIIMKISDKWF
jgi:hypothetical protein